jgi:hypothetical protein
VAWDRANYKAFVYTVLRPSSVKCRGIFEMVGDGQHIE